MKVYVASSWRNEVRQQATVRALREAGHHVYDFRNPSPGDTGFGWRQCATKEQLASPALFRDEVLTHPIARAGFANDMGALSDAAATVLVLPCGRSAHLELGWAAGAGRRTYVLLDDPISEPELMYLACTKLCVSIAEIVTELSASEVPAPNVPPGFSPHGRDPLTGGVARDATGEPATKATRHEVHLPGGIPDTTLEEDAAALHKAMADAGFPQARINAIRDGEIVASFGPNAMCAMCGANPRTHACDEEACEPKESR
jgi:hypothetical protein